MFNLFKEDRPQDVKAIRSALLQFIKEELQKVEGGEGANIRGLYLYMTCADSEKHLYESAVYFDEENRFKAEEIQRIADDFAISLPENWELQLLFDAPPPNAVVASNLDAALFISTKKKQPIYKDTMAYLKVLNGEAEKPLYTINSTIGKVNIGREKKVQTSDGFYRENGIAFPDSSEHSGNRSVSRQHAHIEWDNENGAFCLFADEGGIPPLNKMKVRDAEGNIIKIQTTEIGHHLDEGDQIMLGESAILEFTYNGEIK